MDGREGGKGDEREGRTLDYSLASASTKRGSVSAHSAISWTSLNDQWL